MSLLVDGYQIVRISEINQLPLIRELIESAIGDAKYFNPDSPSKVLGKFQALGDPVSMWHPLLLQARNSIHRNVQPFLKEYSTISCKFVQEKVKFCSVMDRLMIRPHGISIDGEDWHRDVGKLDTLPKDGNLDFFGGFTNFDDTSQRFRCVPGSHKGIDVRNIPDGFLKIPKEYYSLCEEKALTVEVPPGCHIIFHQHIIHTIIKNKNMNTMYRLFHGFIISDSENFKEYIFGGESGLASLALTQSVPRLPSGDIWPIFTKRHQMFKVKPFKIIEDTKIPPSRTSAPKNLKDNLSLIFSSEYIDNFGVTMYMPSLLEMHNKIKIPMMPEVKSEDVDCYRPHFLR